MCLAVSERPHRIMEALFEVATETGVLNGKRRRAVDSTGLDGVVARKDTIMQLIPAIRRFSRDLPNGTTLQATHATGYDYTRVGKLEIAWDDTDTKTIRCPVGGRDQSASQIPRNDQEQRLVEDPPGGPDPSTTAETRSHPARDGLDPGLRPKAGRDTGPKTVPGPGITRTGRRNCWVIRNREQETNQKQRLPMPRRPVPAPSQRNQSSGLPLNQQRPSRDGISQQSSPHPHSVHRMRARWKVPHRGADTSIQPLLVAPQCPRPCW